MRRFFLVERAIFGGKKNPAMMFCRSPKAFIFHISVG